MYKNCVKNIDVHFAGKGEVTSQPRGMFIGYMRSMCTFIFMD